MIRNARNRFHALAFAFLFLVSPSVKADQWSDLAETILGSSEVQGGLIVHLACGRGDLTASLPINDRFIVQGLDRDRAAIQTARELIQSRGLYGQVSARHWDSRQLPYGDNLVNLMVVDHGSPAVRDEIQRVLCPRGVAVTLDDQHTIVEVYRKPVPGNIDEWTHYLHDASNNAVAEDDRVGPPRHLQWKSGPMWSRSHEFSSSVQALISAKGRLIGVFDEGIVGQPRGVPAFWTLIARDAFNGIQLWRIPCDRINPQALTAVGDKVYVTLKSRGPLCILDAATGEELHVCEGSGKVNEIAVYSDRLILSTILPDAQGKPAPHLAVADPEDGHLIWKQPVEAVAPNGLVAGDGRICYFDGHELVCLSLNDGKPLWRTVVSGRSKGYAVLYEGAVFLTGGSTRAFSLDTGELLWTGPDASPHARNPPGLFGAKGLIWRAWGDVDPRSFVWQHREETRNGYDPRTGEVRKTQTAARLVTAGHHIRCYPPKATHRYLLLNKRGVEFFDLEGTEHMRANWTRAACGFGMLPANGFLYTPPSQCFCYQGVLLTGMNALSSTREIPQGQTAQKDQSPRLQPGPAYGSASMSSTDEDTAEPSDWPTYRGDIFRSGTTDASLPAELARVWETSLCAPAFGSVGSSETIADGGTVVHLKSADATVHGQGAQKREDTIVGWRGKDTYITWEPLIDRQGTHTVWISQSNQGPGGSEFELAVGEQKLRGEIHHTDSWDQYVWVRVGEIEIPKAGIYRVSVKPIKQVDGRLGNVAGVSIGGSTPPTGPSAPPRLRERPSRWTDSTRSGRRQGVRG